MVGGVRKDSLLSDPLAGLAGPGDRGAAPDFRQPGRPEEWHCGWRYLPGGHGEVWGRCCPGLSSCVLRAGGAGWWSTGDSQGPVDGRTRDSKVGVQQGPQRGQADQRLVSGRDGWLAACPQALWAPLLVVLGPRQPLPLEQRISPRLPAPRPPGSPACHLWTAVPAGAALLASTLTAPSASARPRAMVLSPRRCPLQGRRGPS